jgi:hypothetical protein
LEILNLSLPHTLQIRELVVEGDLRLRREDTRFLERRQIVLPLPISVVNTLGWRMLAHDLPQLVQNLRLTLRLRGFI